MRNVIAHHRAAVGRYLYVTILWYAVLAYLLSYQTYSSMTLVRLIDPRSGLLVAVLGLSAVPLTAKSLIGLRLPLWLDSLTSKAYLVSAGSLAAIAFTLEYLPSTSRALTALFYVFVSVGGLRLALLAADESRLRCFAKR